MQKQQTLAIIHAPSGITKIPLKGNAQSAPLKRVNSSGAVGRPSTSNTNMAMMKPMVYTYNYRADWKNYVRSIPRIPRIKVLAPGTGYDVKMIK